MVRKFMPAEDFFKGNWSKAMEAPGEPDDITASTDDAMRRAGGRNADTGDFDPSRTSDQTREEDGQELGGDTGMGDIEDVEPDDAGGASPDDAGDDMGGEGGDDMNMGGMDDQGGSPDQGIGDDQTPNETPEQSKSIYNLCMKMNQFFQVLSNTVEALNAYSMPNCSPQMMKVYNTAVNHLAKAKEMLYDLMTTQFTPANYADKLRKYIALRHVYSTILNVLDIHFNTLDQMMQAQQPSK